MNKRKNITISNKLIRSPSGTALQLQWFSVESVLFSFHRKISNSLKTEKYNSYEKIVYSKFIDLLKKTTVLLNMFFVSRIDLLQNGILNF